MKSFGNGFEELMVNGFLALVIIDGIIILSDWFYVIPDQIETWDVIIPLSSVMVITLIILVIYLIKLDDESTSHKKDSVK